MLVYFTDDDETFFTTNMIFITGIIIFIVISGKVIGKISYVFPNSSTSLEPLNVDIEVLLSPSLLNKSILHLADSSLLLLQKIIKLTENDRECLTFVAFGGSVTCGMGLENGKDDAWPQWFKIILDKNFPCNSVEGEFLILALFNYVLFMYIDIR